MITFDELVRRIYTRLVEKRPRDTIAIDVVRSVLDDAGVAELMQRDEVVDAPQRLLIRRVRISGRKQRSIHGEYTPFCYDHILQPGLNGWLAGNGTGKSTVLKVVVWGLTGVEQNIKPDVRAWIEDVAIEIEIANTVYTIRYFLRQEHPKVAGHIYAHELDEVIEGGDHLSTIESFSGASAMTEAVARFFSGQMRFTALQWVQPVKFAVDLEQKTISWEVYSQACFIGADDYSDFLFPRRNVNAKHHQRTLGVYLGFSLTEAVSKLEIERDQARNMFAFEQKRVEVNAQGIHERIEQCEIELRRIEERIQAIETGQSILVNSTHITTIREQMAQWTNQIAELIDAEQKLLTEELQLRNERDKEQRICQELREAIQFKVFLSGLVVERCPHCEQAIPLSRVEEEAQTKVCRVCRSELRPISSTEQHEILLAEAGQKMAEFERAWQKVKKEIRQMAKDREEAEKERARYEAELHDLPRQDRAGFTAEMRELLDRRGYIRGQLQHLREQSPESHSQRLKELKDRGNIFDAALIQLRFAVKQHYDTILERLEVRTTELTKLFGVPNLERVFFDNRLELFINQAGQTLRFSEMENSETLRLKIAFHLALLTLRMSDGVGRHPGLLIVDAPGGAEMDEQHFTNILHGFSRVKEQLDANVQILIASTREELAAICGAERLEHRREGETIF